MHFIWIWVAGHFSWEMIWWIPLAILMLSPFIVAFAATVYNAVRLAAGHEPEVAPPLSSPYLVTTGETGTISGVNTCCGSDFCADCIDGNYEESNELFHEECPNCGHKIPNNMNVTCIECNTQIRMCIATGRVVGYTVPGHLPGCTPDDII